MNRREQGGDESGRGGCRAPDTKIAFARVSESASVDGPKEKNGRVGFGSVRLSIAVLDVSSRSKYREDRDKK